MHIIHHYTYTVLRRELIHKDDKNDRNEKNDMNLGLCPPAAALHASVSLLK